MPGSRDAQRGLANMRTSERINHDRTNAIEAFRRLLKSQEEEEQRRAFLTIEQMGVADIWRSELNCSHLTAADISDADRTWLYEALSVYRKTGQMPERPAKA
jgi:hypothetical protein